MTITKLGAQIILDRAEGIKQILDAFRRAEGNRTRAAEILEIPIRSLHHYCTSLGLWPAIDALCAAEGFKVKHGTKRKV